MSIDYSVPTDSLVTYFSFVRSPLKKSGSKLFAIIRVTGSNYGRAHSGCILWWPTLDHPTADRVVDKHVARQMLIIFSRNVYAIN